MQWDDIKEFVVETAKKSGNCQDLTARVSKATGETFTYNALRSAWRRWQMKDDDLPDIAQVLGSAVFASFAAQASEKVESKKPAPARSVTRELEEEDIAPELVLPRGTKAPEEPPDHSVVDDGSLPRYMFSDGDLHYPIQDPYVEAAKIALARDLNPGVWVNVGDAYDCWLISRHDKEPDRFFDGKSRLQEEFDSAVPYWKEVCSISSRVHFILGNHENRLNKLIQANLGLFNLRSLEWKLMAGIPNEVTVHKYGARLRVGAMTFEHGDRIGNGFGTPMHSGHYLLEKKGNRNTIYGHTHKMSSTFRTVYDEDGELHTYCAINQGHGSSVADQRYMVEPNWQHSFTVVEFWTEAGKPRFTAHPISIVNGRFSFAGKMYDGRKLI